MAQSNCMPWYIYAGCLQAPKKTLSTLAVLNIKNFSNVLTNIIMITFAVIKVTLIIDDSRQVALSFYGFIQSSTGVMCTTIGDI